jgi:hypothetical protein
MALDGTFVETVLQGLITAAPPTTASVEVDERVREVNACILVRWRCAPLSGPR